MSTCAHCGGTTTLDRTHNAAERIHVALAGQPNVGKSTVFNALTGLHQHVGNWPGKTVEQKTGRHTRGEVTLDIVDLPGTYSLTVNSPEERIAREYILTEQPDAIIAIVDAATLERSLYLVAELAQLGWPFVVGLNMLDVAARHGTSIDVRALSVALGVPVVPLVATKNLGVSELVDAAIEAARNVIAPMHFPSPCPSLEAALAEIERVIAPVLPDVYPLNWAALKVLEGDAVIAALVWSRLPPADRGALDSLLAAHTDAPIQIAGARYEWIARVMRSAVTHTQDGSRTLTARLDRVSVHPVVGLGLLAVILAALFGLTYAIGAPIQEWLEATVIGGLSQAASALLVHAPHWLRGLIVDGVIGGAGMVLTFLPILLIFFAGMALLEDVGYMARAAYLMDGFMRLMGLHGKSFLPLFLGLGCNVPAVVGARVVESDKSRLLTILLAPLVPCTARMTVVAFMAPVFFGSAALAVAFSLALLNLLAMAVAGVAINRFVLKGGNTTFILELPQYHLPHVPMIGLMVWQRATAFVKHAGSLILLMAVIVWGLSAIPTGNVETSLLGGLGRLIAPLGALMGLGWQVMVALLASFVAKENSIATLGVLLGAGGDQVGLTARLSAVLTPAAALSYLIVQMLFIPCVATVGAIRQETRSWKWTLFSVGLLAGISFGTGIAAYQVLRLLGVG